jgi:putative peptidoglycan lipid II flippase
VVNKLVIKKLLDKNFWNSQPSKSVMSAAFIITLSGLASRLLGLLRDRLLASRFGAGDTLDVYYAAFRVPDLVYNFIILGALSAAFIPVFTSLIFKNKKGEDTLSDAPEKQEAWEVVNGILNISIFFILLISVIFFTFAPFLMKLITPGFSPEKMDLVIKFTRVMFFSPLLLGISGIFGGVLTSFRRFFVYSLAPIFYNLGIILGILFFVNFWGPIGLAWGVVFGSFLHMLVQYPAVRNLGFKHKKTFFASFKNKHVKEVFLLMIPRVLGIAVNQVNLLVITIFASMLASGSLAIFSFAQNLQGVVLGIFGSSFAIAVFPVLSSLAAPKDRDDFVSAFSNTFRQIIFFVIPLSVFIFVLRAQIVRVVLGSGNFDWEDTILTFECLEIFAFSLFAQSTVPLLARAFYSLHDTKTPFYIALIVEATNILAVLSLIGRFKVVGLAMAFSLASVLQMVLLFIFLQKKLGGLDRKNIFISFLKIGLASFLAGAAIQLVKSKVGFLVNIDTFPGIFFQLCLSFVIGVLVFSLTSYVLKSEEFFNFKNSLANRIFRSRRVVIEESTSDVSGV